MVGAVDKTLSTYTIKDGTRWIGSYAFQGCSSLKSVEIPNSVTEIGSYAFSRCSNLASVVIPSSVTEIENYAFEGCSNLNSPVYNNTIFASLPISYSGGYKIPEGIKTIAGGAFHECSSLTSVEIPNSVTTIRYSAFYGCSGLTSVEIGNSVTTIESFAFFDCSGLTSVKIPNSVTTIGSSAFSGCSSLPVENNLRYAGTYLVEAVDKTLSTYTIKDGTRWIGYGAFRGCSSLTSIEIPNSVVSIEGFAFRGCSSLTSVEIPNSVVSIEYYAFYGCSSLTSVDIPNSVTEIGDYAFQYSSSLTSVVISNSVTEIGDWAFSECSSLTSVEIPSSVTEIGFNAFIGCNNLTSVIFDNAENLILGPGAFLCRNLNEVHIKNPYIPICAQYSDTDNLNAFEYLVPLTETNIPTIDYNTCVLYVPSSMVDAFKAADGWKKFQNIVGVEEPQTDNVLSIEPTTAHKGKTAELPVALTNRNAITEIGFVVELPDGITLDKNARGKYYVNFSDRTDGHTMTANDVDGGVKMAIVNMDGTPFYGNEGVIFTLPLNVSDDLADGDYTVRLKEIQLSDGNLYEAADAEGTVTVVSYTKGDVNNDGRIAVNDISLTIQGYLGNYSDDFIMYAADMNDNNQIDVADISKVISAYLGNGNAAPAKAIARAATEDNLTLENASVEPGKQFDLVIGLDNTKEYTEIGGYIQLPEGMTFATNSRGKYLISLDRDRLPEHTISTQIQANGELKFAIVNMNGDPVEGNTGTIMTVSVDVADGMAYGDYTVKLREIQLSDGNLYETPDVTATISVAANNADAIASVDGGKELRRDIYRLDGTKVREAVLPGLYIMNGKKVAVK